MEALEKKVLKSIIKNLKSSTTVTWINGDMYKWADWAKQMRQSINEAAQLIETLIEEDKNEPPKTTGPVTL
jgi:hypothetical protein